MIQDDILREIKIYHKGKDKAILSAALERRYMMAGAAVRDCIRALRRSGNPVGSCDKGYFYCANKNELEELVANLKGRALSMLKTVSQLEKNREKPEFRQMTFKL